MDRKGAPEDAVVTKIGRSLVTLRTSYREEKFRLDTQIINDNYGHVWFKTAEQAKSETARAESRAVLTAKGITLEYRARLTDEQIHQLAALVRSWEESDNG
jgi:hypothetical protein